MILSFQREQIKAFAQSGLMNIKSLSHWDICYQLSLGIDREMVAMKFRMSVPAIDKIKKCKCPEL